MCRKRLRALPLADTATDPIEQLLLTAYPNPSRKGCPGDHAVAKLAATPDADNPDWSHIRHCSPCFAEFKRMRDARWKREEMLEWLVQTQEADSGNPKSRPD